MSNTLTIDRVLDEVLKNSSVANVTVSVWKGGCVPNSEVAIWDGGVNYYGKTLQDAFARYLSDGNQPSTPEETATEALGMIENPTAAQEEANHQNSL